MSREYVQSYKLSGLNIWTTDKELYNRYERFWKLVNTEAEDYVSYQEIGRCAIKKYLDIEERRMKIRKLFKAAAVASNKGF